MRIRRRPQPPPASPPPPPSPAADPWPQLPPLPTGRVVAWGEEEKRSRSGAGEGGRGLHPDGDRPIDPRRGPRVDPWPSTRDPLPRPSPDASHPNGSCIPLPPDPSRLQGSQEEVKKLEVEVESNKKMGSAQVNGNKRGSGSSGAQVSEPIGGCGEEEKGYQPNKSAVGYDDRDGRDGLDKIPVGRERKAKTKARASATTAPNTINAGIGPSSEKKSDEVVEKEERVVGVGKKRRSPAVLMEGSRCSRVNGRGWRCCQQTLVGYSLCEHHLGKGRLRSMSSVRGQLGTSKPLVIAELANGSRDSSSPQQEQEQSFDANDVKDDEKQEKKKRKKIGMVKARSISSLLDETYHSLESALPPQAAAQEPEVAVEPADALGAMV